MNSTRLSEFNCYEHYYTSGTANTTDVFEGVFDDFSGTMEWGIYREEDSFDKDAKIHGNLGIYTEGGFFVHFGPVIT